MNRHEIEEGIRAFVIEAFLSEEQATELLNSDCLFDLLDSLQVLRLVLRLEPLFGVTVADVLEALHRATEMPIVADFIPRLYPADSVSAREQPLIDVLNRMAGTMGLCWCKQPDGWLQIRGTRAR